MKAEWKHAWDGGLEDGEEVLIYVSDASGYLFDVGPVREIMVGSIESEEVDVGHVSTVIRFTYGPDGFFLVGDGRHVWWMPLPQPPEGKP